MSQLFTNNASGTLSVQAEIVDTTLTLQTNEGQLYPAPTGGDFFQCTLEDTSGNIEIVQCTGRSTDVLTVVRAQESTSAKVFPTGSRVELRPTADHSAFLQVFGGVMQGELDMDDNQLTDPLILGGEARNMPIRGTDGGTANEIIVPTAAGDPTLGGNNIIHTGNDGAYALGATIFTAGDGLDGGGDLSAARTWDLNISTFTNIEGNAVLAADEFLMYDDANTEHKVIAYQDAGIPIISDGAATISPDDTQVNHYFLCTRATAVSFEVDTGVGVKGNVIIVEQAAAGTVTVGGTATINTAVGNDTRIQNSVVVLLCTATDIWTMYGDGAG